MDSIGAANLQAGPKDTRGALTLSRIVNGIKAQRINPTHFLLLKFCFGGNIETCKKDAFRRYFFDTINGNVFSKVIEDDDEPSSIRWKCFNKTASSLYYTKSRLDEMCVRDLTEMMLQEHYESGLTHASLTSRDVRIDFLVTKNLDRIRDQSSDSSKSIPPSKRKSSDDSEVTHSSTSSKEQPRKIPRVSEQPTSDLRMSLGSLCS